MEIYLMRVLLQYFPIEIISILILYIKNTFISDYYITENDIKWNKFLDDNGSQDLFEVVMKNYNKDLKLLTVKFRQIEAMKNLSLAKINCKDRDYEFLYTYYFKGLSESINLVNKNCKNNESSRWDSDTFPDYRIRSYNKGSGCGDTDVFLSNICESCTYYIKLRDIYNIKYEIDLKLL